MITNDFKDLAKLNNNDVNYKGKLKNYQLNATKKITYETDKYNKYQNFLYKRALYGLNMFDEQEIKEMHWQKRKRIIKVHKKAQNVLNLHKQKKTNRYTKEFFKLFYKSRLCIDLIEEVTDPTYINDLDFKTLKISKNDIIEIFIKNLILPRDFYKLKL